MGERIGTYGSMYSQEILAKSRLDILANTSLSEDMSPAHMGLMDELHQPSAVFLKNPSDKAT